MFRSRLFNCVHLAIEDMRFDRDLTSPKLRHRFLWGIVRRFDDALPLGRFDPISLKDTFAEPSRS